MSTTSNGTDLAGPTNSNEPFCQSGTVTGRWSPSKPEIQELRTGQNTSAKSGQGRDQSGLVNCDLAEVEKRIIAAGLSIKKDGSY